MNKQRKERFNEVIASLDEAKDILVDIQAEEQDSYNSLPESLQLSSRGDKMQEYIDLMGCAIEKIDDVIRFIEEEIVKRR